jgi:hypothetical protein
MTAPRNKPASCVHLTNVTVNAPHQVVYDGVVYLGGDSISDVPNPTAAEWIAHGWADDASSKDTAPAKKPPAKATAKK